MGRKQIRQRNNSKLSKQTQEMQVDTQLAVDNSMLRLNLFVGQSSMSRLCCALGAGALETWRVQRGAQWRRLQVNGVLPKRRPNDLEIHRRSNRRQRERCIAPGHYPLVPLHKKCLNGCLARLVHKVATSTRHLQLITAFQSDFH